MNKEVITYEEYSKLLDKLVRQIKSSSILENIKYIYTFMRGGLPIAVHLSHFLEIPMFTDETSQFSAYLNRDCTLVVDDIADTGKTLSIYSSHVTATLFYKPTSSVKPDFYVRETTNWIVFPWEKIDEKPNR